MKLTKLTQLTEQIFITGMASRRKEERRKRGTKVPRTEAWFFEKKIQAIEKRYKL